MGGLIMWNLEKIPKIIHFYWGNEKLSYLRYLSVFSFKKYNPEWTIKIHYPEILGSLKPSWNTGEQANINITENYYEKLKELDVIFVGHNFDKYGFRNSHHEVHKSDFIRWILLEKEGGVWSDFDILYTNPIDTIRENVPENKYIDTCLCPYSWGGHAIGFLMSSSNNIFFKSVHNIAASHFNSWEYQGIGCAIFNNNFKTTNIIKEKLPTCNPIFLNEICVYDIGCDSITKFFLENVPCPINDGIIGFHWYAGHPLAQQYDTIITKDNYKTLNNTISNIIQKII